MPSYRLDPDATVSNQWALVSTASAHAALKGTAVNPAAGETAARVTETTAGDVCEVSVDNLTLGASEAVTQLVLNIYGDTNSQAGVYTAAIYTGTTLLASVTVGPTAAIGWRTATYNGALTQTELNDLRVRLTCTTGNITAVRGCEAYIQVTTAVSAIVAVPSATATAAGGTVDVSTGSTVPVPSGSATAAGGTVAVATGSVIAVPSGSASASGDAAVSTGSTVPVPAGSAVADGGTVDVATGSTVTVPAGAATASGDVDVSTGSVIPVLPGAATVTGGTVTISAGGSASVAIDAGTAIAAGGGDVQVITGSVVPVPAGACVAGGGDVGVSTGVRIVVPSGTATADGGTVLVTAGTAPPFDSHRLRMTSPGARPQTSMRGRVRPGRVT